VALAVALAVSLVAPRPAFASPEEDLAEAQRRANEAAGALSRAETALAAAEDAVAHARSRVTWTEGRVAAARQLLGQLAVQRYVSVTARLSRLLRLTDANQVVRAQQFSALVAGETTDSLERYRAEREDLADEVKALQAKQEARGDALATLREERADAIEEVARLARVVEEQRARLEQAAAQARAQRPPQPPAGAAPGASSAPPSSADASDAVDAPDAAPSGDDASSPGPAPARNPAPAPAPAPAPGSGDWICPVMQPRAFSNDYGAPRGGGYSHQGNDILAPRGTPAVAPVSGYVTHRNGAISGLAYWLDGDDGVRYFGAHLDSFGASGQVSAGTVIGTVGNTGDAAGGPPHLHFEMHPGGGGPINPYSTLVKYC
jgi:murein DD-endopeptidase MepM/ murein hydrolase activator NlpD